MEGGGVGEVYVIDILLSFLLLYIYHFLVFLYAWRPKNSCALFEVNNYSYCESVVK